MPKHEVVIPWYGVKKGDVLDLKTVHPVLKANLRPVAEERQGKLEPATPGDRKGVIAKRLKELKIEFDGRKGEEELAALLPKDELAKLFPAQ